MEDIICVELSAMYELEDEVRRFGSSLDHCHRDIRTMTDELGSSFNQCSRYKYILEAVSKITKELDRFEDKLAFTAKDISQRAEVIKMFEKP